MDAELLSEYESEMHPQCEIRKLGTKVQCTNRADYICDVPHVISTGAAYIGFICGACVTRSKATRYPVNCPNPDCDFVFRSPTDFVCNLRPI